MSINAGAVCAGCLGPIEAGARRFQVMDMTFHPFCAPRCRACGSRLTTIAQESGNSGTAMATGGSGAGSSRDASLCQACADLAWGTGAVGQH